MSHLPPCGQRAGWMMGGCMRTLRHDLHLWTVCTDHFFPVSPSIRSDHTKAQYRIAVDDFGEALGRRGTLGDLSDDNVCRMMVHLRERGLATRTINERRGRINTLWEWAARRGHVRHFPTVKRLAEPHRTPQAWTREQLGAIFVAIGGLEGSVGGVLARVWWRALLLTLWNTGERIGALLSIGWQHVDLETGWLTIPAELRKGQARDMTYRLSPETLEILKLLPRGTKTIFHWPYDAKYIFQRFEAILKTAGLPHGRKDKFHRLRRSVASHFEAAGGDATSLLGHSTRATTLVYLDPRIVGQQQATDLLFTPEPPAGPPRAA